MTPVLRFVNRWWTIGLLVAVWQGIVSSGAFSTFVLPGPVDVLAALVEQPGIYLVPALRTIMTAAVGLVIGVSLGLAMASASWLVPPLRGAVLPLALVLRSVPFVALVPVMARLFGYGVTSAFVITTLVCFFPTFVLVSTGLNDVPPNSLDVFRVSGASRRDQYRRLALPSAMPNLATAVRISSGTSILAALIAEFLMGTPGLARLLVDALTYLHIDRVWSASLVAMALSVAVFLMATRYEARVRARWR